MLGSLEELGLVRRSVATADRRQKWVELTTEGRSRIAFAHRHVARSGWAQLAIDTALAGKHAEHRWCDEAACREATSSLQIMLNDLRRGFYDFATLEYPSGPQELITWFDYYDDDALDMWPETVFGFDPEQS